MAAAYSQQSQGVAERQQDFLEYIHLAEQRTLYIHPVGKVHRATEHVTKFYVLQSQQYGIAALEVNEQTESVVLIDCLDRVIGRGHGGLSRRNSPGTYGIDEMTFSLVLNPGSNRTITATITNEAAFVNNDRIVRISRRENPATRSSTMFITDDGTQVLIATCEVNENSMILFFRCGIVDKYVKAFILILMLKQSYLPLQLQHSPMPITLIPEAPAPMVHLQIFTNLRNLRFQLACRDPQTGAYYLNIMDAETSRRVLVNNCIKWQGNALQRITNIHGEEQVIATYGINQPRQGPIGVWTPDRQTEIGRVNNLERKWYNHYIINNNGISPQLQAASVPSAQSISTIQEKDNEKSHDHIVTNSASGNQVARIYVDQYTVVLSILDNNLMETDIALLISYVGYLCFNSYCFHRMTKVTQPYVFVKRDRN